MGDGPEVVTDGEIGSRAATVAPVSPRLVIFDCDGVLVDSEVLVVQVEAELLTAAGFALSPDQLIERYVGLSYGLMMERLTQDFGRPVPPELQARIETAALARLRTDLRPVAGMPDLLRSLDAEARPRCVASSSDPERIRLSLAVTGLDRWFDDDHVFSTRMVERPKPAPDVFLLAAERLGAEPGQCVVIEDSPSGVAAARAAEMRVIGLTAGGHCRDGLAARLREAGADDIVASTAALAPHLGLGSDRP